MTAIRALLRSRKFHIGVATIVVEIALVLGVELSAGAMIAVVSAVGVIGSTLIGSIAYEDANASKKRNKS